MITKWRSACILLLIISFCTVGFASAAPGDGNGSKMGQKFKSQLIETKTKSLSGPSGSGTYGNPYVFETCVVYQFWGPLYGWADVNFVDQSWGREGNSYLSDCPMASWSKVQTGYSEDECKSGLGDTQWWGGYYEGFFSSPSGLSTGKHWRCCGGGYNEFYYVVNGQSSPVASFTFTPTSGPCPLTVQFTDTSTGSPASWLWNFGDGNTSTERNPVHVYTSPGTYNVSLTVSNCGGSDTTTSTNSITGSASAPAADFTGTPTSGTRPLTVQFTDTSTGSPTSWLWDFGDGSTSTLQNPQYTYTEIGCYNVRLTVSDSVGNDTETKEGFITVTGHYYVYSDGISLYHGYEGNSDLSLANTTAREFYEHIDGKEGTVYHSIEWEGLANPLDDATGSGNWDINEDANSMANNADFAFHIGHGWDSGLLFGTANPDYELSRDDMNFGGNNGRAKYVALFSCNVLNQSTQSNWESLFNGLHILMGFDTKGAINLNQGSQFADRMTGTGIYIVPEKIRDAWMLTLQYTINDASIKGAYMWADPSGEDYLPGFGSFMKPVKDSNRQYTLHWDSFECVNQ